MNKIDRHNNKYKFTIDYYVFNEKGTYISYCPSLDLSTSGDTISKAKSNFKEMFNLYLETCIEMGTLEADLEAHGWEKVKNNIKLPTFDKLMKKPEMKKLMNSNIGFNRIPLSTSIPAFV